MLPFSKGIILRGKNAKLPRYSVSLKFECKAKFKNKGHLQNVLVII